MIQRANDQLLPRLPREPPNGDMVGVSARCLPSIMQAPDIKRRAPAGSGEIRLIAKMPTIAAMGL